MSLVMREYQSHTTNPGEKHFMQESKTVQHRTWVEIDLNALKSNAFKIKKILGDATLFAVIKKDAYGHGAAECAKALQETSLDLEFAVCTFEEGLELRDAGIYLPILVMAPLLTETSEDAIEAQLTSTIVSGQQAKILSDTAESIGKKAKYAFKVDTGMGRIGFYPEQAIKEFTDIQKFEHLELESVYSHVSAIDIDDEYTEEQYQSLIKFSHSTGVKTKLHLGQSGVIRKPNYKLNGARIGLALYGAYPKMPELEPVMTFKSRVIFEKQNPQGSSISYGRTYKTPEEMKVAVVGSGYGNGYLRSLSNQGEILHAGKRAPVIGKVCMDQFMVDANSLPEIKIGDEVILFGKDGDLILPVYEIAKKAGTISYELCCLAGRLNPRIYRH